MARRRDDIAKRVDAFLENERLQQLESYLRRGRNLRTVELSKLNAERSAR